MGRRRLRPARDPAASTGAPPTLLKFKETVSWTPLVFKFFRGSDDFTMQKVCRKHRCPHSLFQSIELRASVYLGILDGRLPMTQVGSLRECRCPGVVHTGDLPPVSVVIQVGTTISALCFL